jgi:Domain of unknown function (DUF1877)
MSIEYFAYAVSPFLIEKLAENSNLAFTVFWEANEFKDFQEYVLTGNIDLSELGADAATIFAEAKYSEETEDTIGLYTIGEFAESLHVLLSGEGSLEMTDFIVSNRDNLLLINALIGRNKVRNIDIDAFYIYPSEVREIVNALPTVLEEDLEQRWSKLRYAARKDFYSFNEVTEFLNEELLPFYEKASARDFGILIVIST